MILSFRKELVTKYMYSYWYRGRYEKYMNVQVHRINADNNI